uniref:Uncharacterized protein n=1 Tax=Magnetococcus massalia (strain MO-1) TaxID=451514 RepID=A0A1S7LEN0_MAGMO|nr:protein of unknown function [Candidatus Magnetococcus massalia]
MSIYGLSTYMSRSATQGMNGPKKDGRDDGSRDELRSLHSKNNHSGMKENRVVKGGPSNAYRVTISAAALNQLAGAAV